MSRKQEIGLLGLLLLAGLAIRLSFFIPFQGSDDIGYNEAAHHLASGTYRLEPNLFYLRFGVILPMALSFKLLGVSPLASSLSLLVCSLLMVVLAYAVASHLFDRRVAWLAAILMTVFPLNVFSATEVHADLPMSLHLGLALLCVLKAGAAQDSRTQIAWGVASGVFWGIAYLTKIPALLTFPAFLVGYRLATKKRLGRILIPLAIGFLAVVAVEMTVYIVYTGDPLYQVHTILRQGHTQAIDRAYPDWRAGLKAVLTVYPDMMFNLLSFDNAHFGWHYYLAVLGVLLSQRGARWPTHPLVIYSVATFAALNFSVRSLKTLAPIQHHFPRTLDPLTLPCVIWAAVFLDTLTPRWRGVVLSATLLASVANVALLHADAGYYTQNSRVAFTQYLSTLDRTSPIIADRRTVAILAYLSGYTMRATRYEDVPDFTTLPHAYVVVDAHQIDNLTTQYGDHPPDLVFHPPPSWKAVYRTVPSKRISVKAAWARGEPLVNPFAVEPDSAHALVIYRIDEVHR